MLHPGLVSITFRQLSPAQVVELVAQAQLTGIEWGGDVHVPHGDEAQARHVAQLTADAGLAVAAYGSYYRVSHPDTGPFEAVLATAVALGAPTIRVWAGRQGTDETDEAYFEQVVADSRRIAEQAQAQGIGIAFEFHSKTLTDSNGGAMRLLRAVHHPNVRSLWQPPRYSDFDYNLAGLAAVRPWLENVHVFQWHEQTGERRPLAEGADVWPQYLARAAEANDRERYALLEFVQDDAPDAFLRDAQTLKQWLGSGE